MEDFGEWLRCQRERSAREIAFREGVTAAFGEVFAEWAAIKARAAPPPVPTEFGECYSLWTENNGVVACGLSSCKCGRRKASWLK